MRVLSTDGSEPGLVAVSLAAGLGAELPAPNFRGPLMSHADCALEVDRSETAAHDN